MPIYRIWNAPMPTTAALAAVTTNTAIETLLQVSPPSTRQIQVVGWGVQLDDPPGADAVFELLQTDVAATVTAHTSTGIVKWDPNGTASLVTLGTANTGYTGTAEGSITATRVFDAWSLSSTTAESALEHERNWPPVPGMGPLVAVSTFLRVRSTTPTTGVGARTWVDYLE